MELQEEKTMLCDFCLEKHSLQIVQCIEHITFKDTEVEYPCTYYYCDLYDELYADEEMLSRNDLAVKNAYRLAKGLLTTDEIIAIRHKYGISQNDLCLLLGWGAKTIARYEAHQVQDVAHDTILRRLGTDPEWFLSLLKGIKNDIQRESYKRYFAAASMLL